ncbi:putative eka-like protein [Golovinomyces cichoracearum]|uniref:Putative eka-like protein n=1 Tax=Golovinomyces cichoracearum TaxID=62708 RepID=A0A420J5B5_9PEZI|nr:putative eka-like protein [Golovinomyces cichoracearum]
MAESARFRARSRLKSKGLAIDLIDIDAVEAAVLEHNSSDIEMIDAYIDKLIARGLKESQRALENSGRPPTIKPKLRLLAKLYRSHTRQEKIRNRHQIVDLLSRLFSH